MNTQPEALRLADLLEDWAKDYATTDFDCDMGDQAATEMRRLHEENQSLSRCLFQMQEAAKKLTGEVAALSANALDDYRAKEELLESLRAIRNSAYVPRGLVDSIDDIIAKHGGAV